jgi:RNA polymerase sigma-70 factor (ECF subfamily)
MRVRALKKDSVVLTLQHLDSLYQFALFLTDKSHPAEDLVGETYLRAHFHGPLEYGTTHKVRLFTMMHSIFLDGYRQGSREGADADTDSQEEGGYTSPPDREIFRGSIERALSELPDPLKAVVVLKDAFGFDHQEIARILGCPIGMVRSRLWRGRNLLKERLKGYSQDITSMRAQRDSAIPS